MEWGVARPEPAVAADPGLFPEGVPYGNARR